MRKYNNLIFLHNGPDGLYTYLDNITLKKIIPSPKKIGDPIELADFEKYDDIPFDNRRKFISSKKLRGANSYLLISDKKHKKVLVQFYRLDLVNYKRGLRRDRLLENLSQGY